MNILITHFYKYFFLGLFFIFQSSFISAQLHPFPTFADNGQWLIWGSGLGPEASFYLSFEKDTTFCGYTWSKLETNFPKPSFYRNDSLKTYIRYGNNCNASEFLVFDFGLNQGDSTHIGVIMEDTLGGGYKFSPTLAWVDTSFFVTINGVKRKKMVVSVDCPANSSSPWTCTRKWLQGIGELDEPFYPMTFFQWILEWSDLVACYDSSGTNLYLASQFSSCLEAEVADEIPDLQVKVGPNPFVGGILIEFDHPISHKAKLISTKGEVVRGFGESITRKRYLELELDLAPGIYFLLINTERKTYVRKLLKTK